MKKLEEVRRKSYHYSKDVLRADDPRFNRETYILHHDGVDIMRGSFIVRYKHSQRDFIVVFPEHFGVRVYFEDDLQDFAQFGRAPSDQTDLESYQKYEGRIPIENIDLSNVDGE